MGAKRATYLHVSEIALLDTWGWEVREMFGQTPYLVGSALERADHRDVDVRTMLPDKRYEKLRKLVDVDRLNLAVSLWGQKATGMPIDFQIQHAPSANEDYPGDRRPLGMSRRAAEVSR